MVNYGYDSTTKGWKEERKILLAQRLSEEFDFPIMSAVVGVPDDRLNKSKTIKTFEDFAQRKVLPYIEIDVVYEGVRIRKITSLSDEDREKLVEKADRIYCEVMEVSGEVHDTTRT